MRIDVRGVHLKLSNPLLDYVNDHLIHALDCHQTRVETVNVRLSDDTSHKRHNEDKRCHVMIGLRGRAPVIIEERGADLYAMIDSAAQRAKRAVREQISRRRGVRRHHPAMLAA